jgi:ATP-dependent Lon protease
MPEQSFGLPPTFDGVVRLFPLSDLVLFPNNALPLHIFESRYREMFEDAMQGDELITMATLKPGFQHDYYSRPPVSPIVCIGLVTAQEKTQQGTYNFMLVGLQRARIDHEIEPVRSFRRASVQLIEDHSVESDSEGRIVGEQLAGRLLQALPLAKKLVEGFMHGRISLATLADVIAFHLPLATDLKLQLLAEASVLKRAKLLLANFPSLEGRKRRNGAHPTDFSEN